MKSLCARLTATAALTALCSSMALAGTTSIDVSGIDSWDAQGDPDNVVLSIALCPGPCSVTGLGWDVTITPFGLSWYSEATALFTDSAGGGGVSVSPGAADGFADDGVPLAYSSGGILDLTDNGVPDILLADGILLIEFYDSFDDVADAVDSTWGGTLTVQTIPLPGAVWLLASGLLGLAGLRRRG